MRHDKEHSKKGKHCHNCKYLEWGEGDVYCPSGWCCNRRDYDTVEQETKHLNQLEDVNYRFKGKRCFKAKGS